MKKLFALLLFFSSIFAHYDLVVKGVLLKDNSAGVCTIWDVDNNERYNLVQSTIPLTLTNLTVGKFRILMYRFIRTSIHKGVSVSMNESLSTLLEVVEKEKVLTPEEYNEIAKKN